MKPPIKPVDVKKLYDDFADLGWDYTAGRMSRSAMECYDQIAINLSILNEGEHWNEDVFEAKGGYH